MRSLSRNLFSLFLVAGLAVPVLVTGCQSQAPTQSQAAPQPAPQDDAYLKWEHDTNRQHVDLEKRSADERKQYDDWKGSRH
jgi:uncharacterized lipoprotein YajG